MNVAEDIGFNPDSVNEYAETSLAVAASVPPVFCQVLNLKVLTGGPPETRQWGRESK